jgi:molybdenum cofactor cytidylyltransferase
MELIKALRINNTTRLALVGAGGKTTALFTIARELKSPVLVTASAHLGVEQIKYADIHIIIKTSDELELLNARPLSGIILVTGPISGDRTTRLPLEILSGLDQYCIQNEMPMIIEADGSRKRPLKAPAVHEPPIPNFVDTVVIVAGLSALEKPLTSACVHRPELFSALSGIHIGAIIKPVGLLNVLTHKKGGLKNIPKGVKRIALLNQADTPDLQKIASEMAKSLLSVYDSVIVSSFGNPLKNGTGEVLELKFQIPNSSNDSLLAVHEPVAGIILAAGKASRFGEAKQLLLWQGKPLVWHAAQCALKAGLSPVFVVIGAYSEMIKAALSGLNIEMVHNRNWQQGQGTSVSTGVKALPSQSGAAIFLLADQPFTPEKLIRELIETHTNNLSQIVAPWIDGRFANPVLFDRYLFPDLANLSGDDGGRSLFSRFEIYKVKWSDSKILFDVDTLEDYHQLLSLDNNDVESLA